MYFLYYLLKNIVLLIVNMLCSVCIVLITVSVKPNIIRWRNTSQDILEICTIF